MCCSCILFLHLVYACTLACFIRSIVLLQQNSKLLDAVTCVRRGHELPTLTGAYRRLEVESKLNASALRHLLPSNSAPEVASERLVSNDSMADDSMFIMEDGLAGDSSAPSVLPAGVKPVQVYDFGTKATYDDMQKVIHVDHVADTIRYASCVSVRLGVCCGCDDAPFRGFWWRTRDPFVLLSLLPDHLC